MFQQDKASIYKTIGVKNYFILNEGQVLLWQSNIPNPNIVENIWTMLVRLMHAGRKQYESLSDLREASNNSWDTFKLTEIYYLNDSFPNRTFDFVKANGKSISY